MSRVVQKKAIVNEPDSFCLSAKLNLILSLVLFTVCRQFPHNLFFFWPSPPNYFFLPSFFFPLFLFFFFPPFGILFSYISPSPFFLFLIKYLNPGTTTRVISGRWSTFFPFYNSLVNAALHLFPNSAFLTSPPIIHPHNNYQLNYYAYFFSCSGHQSNDLHPSSEARPSSSRTEYFFRSLFDRHPSSSLVLYLFVGFQVVRQRRH